MTVVRLGSLSSLFITVGLVGVAACVGDDPSPATVVDEDAGGGPQNIEAGPGSEGGGGDGSSQGDGATPPTGTFAWETHTVGPVATNGSIGVAVGGTAATPFIGGIFSTPSAATTIEGKQVVSTGLATFRARGDKTVDWVNQIATLVQINDVAVDSVGDIYIVGPNSNTTPVVLSPTVTLPAVPDDPGVGDYTLKLRGTDGTPLWVRSIASGATVDVSMRTIATRGTDVVVGGFFKGQTTYVLKTAGGSQVNTTLQSDGDLDGFVLFLDGSDGTVRWGKKIGGLGSDSVNALAFDADGSVLVGGYSGPVNTTATVALNVDTVPTGITTPTGSFSGFALRFGPTGTHDITLSKAFSGPNAFAQIYGVAASPDHGVTVCGSFSGTGAVQFAGTSESSKGSADVFIANVSTGGAATWARVLGGSGSDSCTGIVVDPSGNTAVGITYGSGSVTLDQHMFKDGDSSHPQSSVFKLDPTGKLAWAFDVGGTSASIESVAMVPGTGDVVYSGYFLGTANLGAGDVQSANTGTAPSFFAVRRGN